MRINLPCETLEILVVVAVLLLGNRKYFSLGNLSRMKFCRSLFGKSCMVTCQRLNLSFWKDVDRLRNVMEMTKEDHTSCTLVLNQCLYSRSKNINWEEIISTTYLENLKLLNSQINLNDIALNKFKNLKRLTIQNTTTNYLSAKTFHSMPKLRKLYIRRNPNLKWVEEGLLQTTNFKFLQIHGMNLNQSETKDFFRNLTGGYDVPTIHGLDWSHNNFGNFTEDLLKNFPNLHYLILRNSNIFELEKGVFASKNINILNVDRNKIVRLPKENSRMVRNISKTVLNENHQICHFHNVTCTSCNKEVLLSEMFSKTLSNIIHQTNHTQKPKFFSVTNINPKHLEINISNLINLERVFVWYINFNISSPQYDCLKVSQRKFELYVTPNTDYLICIQFSPQIDCQLFRSEPPYETQTWLTKKWISLSISLIVVIFLLGALTGASILYLSVHKNPSLIRGSKRVIEVKRHDKAQVLIMPRGYENSADTDNAAVSLLNPHQTLGPSTLSLSSDTLSTVSYISANQPTQFEIFTYRLNRLREIFQNNNNLPPPVPSYLPQSSSTSRQRIPPNVDLLFEYEWYTITTTTTTTQV